MNVETNYSEAEVISSSLDSLGQSSLNSQILSASLSPSCSYMMFGPSGTNRFGVSLVLAAALMGSNPARLLAGHPDVLILEPSGSAYLLDEVKVLNKWTSRSPIQADYKVCILKDADSLTRAADSILKLVEEPPSYVVFILLAEEVTDSLVTIASRCQKIEFPFLSNEFIASELESILDASLVERVTDLANGNLNSALLYATNPVALKFAGLFDTLSTRLRPCGASIQKATDVVFEMLDVLQSDLKDELVAYEDEIKNDETRSYLLADVEKLHKRRIKSFRLGLLETGLRLLLASYEDSPERESVLAYTTNASRRLERNVNERLVVSSMLFELKSL